MNGELNGQYGWCTPRLQCLINLREMEPKDMYIFGDPLHVPIIIVERLTNIYHSTSASSDSIPMKEEKRHKGENGYRATNKSGSIRQQNEHVLRILVFVRGFQGNHLDLRLI
ncbi:hypothetical protein PIB30_034897 [Stylosanthes scabra]|uniref:Uncharacterized protein n=1 Tax=Stylosanthes scabra TaxID=79078 RepID=A0ABU6SCS5_9FABA|nr:hypothetical protein [Stylosanthes scabra]